MGYAPSDFQYGTTYGQRVNAGSAQANKFLKRALITGGAMTGGGLALSSILGGSAAGASAGGGWSMPGVSAPTFGSAAPAAGGATSSSLGATSSMGAGRLASILGGRGFETAANLGLGVAGIVSQNKANSQARKDTLAASMKAIELEQQRLTAELRNADLDREDARALNAAIQELEGKKFALMQEDSEFSRESEMWQRGKYDQEQSRLAPYRAASGAATQKLSSILGIG